MEKTGQATIWLPRSLASQLGIRPGRTVRVRWGRWKGRAVVEVAEDRSGSVEIRWPATDCPPAVRPGSRRRLRYVDGTLDLGPVLAVLIGAEPGEGRKIPGLVRTLLRTGEQQGVLIYACYGSEIDWNRRRVWGWRPALRGGSGWRWWPLPDAIYNRIPHRSEENLPSAKQVKVEAAVHRICLFNSGFIDKWKTYEILSGDAVLRSCLPRTERLEDPSRQIRRWLDEGEAFYLKPVHGSLGEGLVLSLPGADGWRVGQQAGGVVRWGAGGVSAVYRRLVRLASRRPFLLQKRVDLLLFQGRRVDFRVHLQRGSLGRWTLVALAGKGAGSGALSTHVRYGGIVWPAERVLGAWFGGEAAAWRKHLADLAVAAAERLEGALGGRLAELGLDVGIDAVGRTWVFEANAKPGHHIFSHPDLRSARVRWARLVVDYAADLAEGAGRKGVEHL
ncbi:MAG: YheC/YheD family protein [Alicyclobacillaceae bacterium]|nr:YheC/YheD family protein [Alicyclobacillaceae bacterium]